MLTAILTAPHAALLILAAFGSTAVGAHTTRAAVTARRDQKRARDAAARTKHLRAVIDDDAARILTALGA